MTAKPQGIGLEVQIQRSHVIYTTSYQCQRNVMTSHRCRVGVVSTLHARWESDLGHS